MTRRILCFAGASCTTYCTYQVNISDQCKQSPRRTKVRMTELYSSHWRVRVCRSPHPALHVDDGFSAHLVFRGSWHTRRQLRSRINQSGGLLQAECERDAKLGGGLIHGAGSFGGLLADFSLGGQGWKPGFLFGTQAVGSWRGVPAYFKSRKVLIPCSSSGATQPWDNK